MAALPCLQKCGLEGLCGLRNNNSTLFCFYLMLDEQHEDWLLGMALWAAGQAPTVIGKAPTGKASCGKALDGEPLNGKAPHGMPPNRKLTESS